MMVSIITANSVLLEDEVQPGEGIGDHAAGEYVANDGQAGDDEGIHKEGRERQGRAAPAVDIVLQADFGGHRLRSEKIRLAGFNELLASQSSG